MLAAELALAWQFLCARAQLVCAVLQPVHRYKWIASRSCNAFLLAALRLYHKPREQFLFRILGKVCFVLRLRLDIQHEPRNDGRWFYENPGLNCLSQVVGFHPRFGTQIFHLFGSSFRQQPLCCARPLAGFFRRFPPPTHDTTSPHPVSSCRLFWIEPVFSYPVWTSHTFDA